MANILCSPSKYVQGAGEMKKLGEYAQKYGKKALVLITESGYKRIEDVLKVGFEGYDIEPVYEYFNRECSRMVPYEDRLKFVLPNMVKQSIKLKFKKK